MKTQEKVQKSEVNFPSVDDMKSKLSVIDEMLSIKQLNMNKNAEVKEGLLECQRILQERIANPQNNWFKPERREDVQLSVGIYREQIKGIEKLKSQQGRAMAVMCVDYLNGQLDESVFEKFRDMIKLR